MATRADERVLALHPEPGKQPTRVRRDAYEAYRRALLRVVPRAKQGAAFGELADLVAGVLPAPIASTTKPMWWVTTVKLDLEARGHLERVAGAGPQRVRRTSLGASVSPAEVVNGAGAGAKRSPAGASKASGVKPRTKAPGAGKPTPQPGDRVPSESLDAWLGDAPERVRECALALVSLVREAAPDAIETFHPGWRAVGYMPEGATMRSGVGCSVLPHAKHVNLQFANGVGLHAPPGLLEGTGKAARHIKVRSLGDIEPKLFARLVRDCMKTWR